MAPRPYLAFVFVLIITSYAPFMQLETKYVRGLSNYNSTGNIDEYAPFMQLESATKSVQGLSNYTFDFWNRIGNINNKANVSQKIAHHYQNHHDKMKELINGSSVLRGPYSTLFEEFPHVSIDADTDLHSIPNLHEYGVVHFTEVSLCKLAKVFNRFRRSSRNKGTHFPHVAILEQNPDFGALSSPIPNHTAKYPMGPQFWKQREGCIHKFVMKYLNHPDTLAVFTSQFQTLRHEKVISVPIGLQRGSARAVENYLYHKYESASDRRTDLLMINVRPWEQRTTFMKQVLENFNTSEAIIQKSTAGVQDLPPLSLKEVSSILAHDAQQHQLRNTYQLYHELPHKDRQQLYLEQLTRSKFTWSPSGMGFDCYRHWESLYLGTIPIVAHLGRWNEDGWLSETLKDLPILFVEQHQQITPQFLEQAYLKIVLEPPPGGYAYEKLTKQYWVHKVYSYLPKRFQKQKQVHS